ncbi:hypothetical protein E1B28_013700 [Marasmius oreades]|uniref:Uncharacterized protein n=1 Tax=Marasmius oreades TaxID=181124 RepID=A0A9P7RQB4_9AGAR|nr:uncharacterized protein E1B28_013700 [Marasmius oreades]KAG7087759.1 hypothetical protein E1B28_013700 [Marasmius oreades]
MWFMGFGLADSVEGYYMLASDRRSIPLFELKLRSSPISFQQARLRRKHVFRKGKDNSNVISSHLQVEYQRSSFTVTLDDTYRSIPHEGQIGIRRCPASARDLERPYSYSGDTMNE